MFLKSTCSSVVPTKDALNSSDFSWSESSGWFIQTLAVQSVLCDNIWFSCCCVASSPNMGLLSVEDVELLFFIPTAIFWLSLLYLSLPSFSLHSWPPTPFVADLTDVAKTPSHSLTLPLFLRDPPPPVCPQSSSRSVKMHRLKRD